MTESTTIATPGDEDPGVFKSPELALEIDTSIAKKLGRDEIGYLVEQYYEIQKARIRAGNRASSLEKRGEPVHLMTHYEKHLRALEGRTAAILRAWCREDDVSSWALEVYGIGPVLAAGLAAHFRLAKSPSPSSFWRFAGLDPTCVWGTGEKRPWNATLKVLCWKIGQSFIKVSGRPQSLYGRLYRERKVAEVAKNEAGAFKETAATTLASKKFRESDTKKSYEAGLLPAGRLDLRAQRYATKIFLAHYWECAWRLANPGKEPPRPYVLEHGGHVHKIDPEVAF